MKVFKINLFIVMCLTIIFTLIFLVNVNGASATPEIRAGIKQFQTYINNNLPMEYLLTPLVVDGYAGQLTKTAAVKLLQYRLNSDYSAGLDIDGEFGSDSQAAYRQYKGVIERYQTGPYVYILQGLLYCHYYDPNGFDGSYGSGGGTGCLNSVNQYKTDNLINEYLDEPEKGKVGVETMTSLCWKSFRLVRDGVYYIKNFNSNLFLHVESGGINNFTNVCQYYKTGTVGSDSSLSQLWRVKYIGNDQYSIRPIHKLRMGLDVTGSNVDIYSAGVSDDSTPLYARWKIHCSNEGYLIQNQNTLNYMTVSNSSLSSGANVCDAQLEQNMNHQVWIFESVNLEEGVRLIPERQGIHVDESVSYKVTIFFFNDLAQDYAVSSMNPQIAIISEQNQITAKRPGTVQIVCTTMYDCNYYDYFYLTVGALTDGEYFIKNLFTKRYADVESTETGAEIYDLDFNSESDSQRWHFELHSDGYYRIKSTYSNKYLGVYQNKTTEGAYITQYSVFNGDGCKWQVESVGSFSRFRLIPKTGEASNPPKVMSVWNEHVPVITQKSEFYYDSESRWVIVPSMYNIVNIAFDEPGIVRNQYFPDVYNLTLQYRNDRIYTDYFDCYFENTVRKLMTGTEIFVIHTHGTKTSFEIGSGDFCMADLGNTNLENLELALLLCCYTAKDYNSNNILNNTPVNLLEKIKCNGAQTVIGFKDIIYVEEVNKFIVDFLNLTLEQRCTVQEAIEEIYYDVYPMGLNENLILCGNGNLLILLFDHM